ncbi:hypothetical protein PVAP13_2NG388303 [Panicum virgatum]|uniref:Uncharacterized protein n=1 Tax=Panicum virgatum TaxID=38727 RepID=A0A8T0VLY0_PANVG|nr:hypothetical protein PVAP13_2NG388303 [Panicum virgatum]
MAGHGPGGCASVQGRRARPRRADDLYASAPRIRPRSLISLTSPGDVSVSRRRQPRGAEPGRPSTRLGRALRDADELPARAENTGASPITCLFARDARAERASSGQRHRREGDGAAACVRDRRRRVRRLWLVKLLLSRGYAVHATVRDPSTRGY